MSKNNRIAAILFLAVLVFGSQVAAQSRPVTNPAGLKAAKSKANKRVVTKKVKTTKDEDKEVKYGDVSVLPMTYYGVSLSLEELSRRNVPAVMKDEEELQREAEPKEFLLDGGIVNLESLNEQNIQTAPTSAPSAVRGTNFEGLGNGFPGYNVNVAPPDPTLAVGPNHIVQWINLQYAVFNKSGTKLLGPVNGNTLFAGMGNGCETNNNGDPILQYDRLADRWIMSQFSISSQPFLQCVAVSTTNNPTGTYYRYTINFGSRLNDYPKLGIWTDAYYTSYNDFDPSGNNFLGGELCASERTKMLAGDGTAKTICFFGGYAGDGSSFLPVDFDGTQLPTDTTQGGIFMRFATDTGQLRYVKLKPNFATPANSTLTNGFGGATGSFIELSPGAPALTCNGGVSCINQPGTTTQLDSLGDRLMYRLVYRNRGGTDSLIVTRAIDPDGAGAQSAAVAWYEIRNPLKNPADPIAANRPYLHQNSVYNPDASGNRWMSSMAMDKFGNILMGYSYVNAPAGIKPSIAIAGRKAGDPINTLQSEIIDTTGTGSQIGGLTRWGDYSTMQIDPADDRTFWFTTQYLSADGSFKWNTRVTSYRFPVTTTAIADGNISDGNNFDNGLPDSTVDVIIPAGRTITVDTATTVNSLTIASGGNLIMNADLRVNGLLTLGTTIDTGTSKLSLGCAAAVSGASASNYIIGNLSKDLCAVQSFTFPIGTENGYSPMTSNVTALGISPSTLTVKANQDVRPGLNPAQSLMRYWTVSEIGDLTANLSFQYIDPDDISGIEAGYQLFRIVGNVKTPIMPFTPNIEANTIWAAGISTFGDFVAGNIATNALVVTKTADTNDGMCNADCSLREAMDVADSNNLDDRIFFNIPANSAGCNGKNCTINLTSAIAPAADAGFLTIVDGDAASGNTITLDGDGATQILNIGSAVNIIANDLNFTGGGGGGGGAIAIAGGGSLMLSNSALFGNTASLGGAIYAASGSTLNLTNVTVSGNAANGGSKTGGGIYNAGSVTATNCTITNNTAQFQGGVVTFNNSMFNVRNTVIAGNTASVSPDASGLFTSRGSNIIGKSDGASGFTASDQIGTVAAPLDARLAPLGSYGGKTFTHALLNGGTIVSPAINAGNSGAMSTDQRVAARVGNVDISAFEVNSGYVAALSDGKLFTLYDQPIAPEKGSFSYTLVSGTLPPGLFLLPAPFNKAGEDQIPTNITTTVGRISIQGTPLIAGIYPFSLRLDNGVNSTVINYSISVAAEPTPAGVSVSGRVIGGNRGLTNATVTMTDSDGATRTARTSASGYYRFENVAVGQTYVVSARSNLYQFTPQVISIFEKMNELNFYSVNQ